VALRPRLSTGLPLSHSFSDRERRCAQERLFAVNPSTTLVGARHSDLTPCNEPVQDPGKS
jgi:hypothetical protein